MARSITDEFTASIDLEHRRRHGQFFTPPSVAGFMCRWVMPAGTREVYDPAFGLGAFHDAAKSADSTVRFSGSEIDPLIFNFWHQRNEPTVSVANEDYLSVWGRRHSAIVCNPPYMRFQLFTNRDKVASSFASKLGMTLSGYTNIASAFLLKSLSELKPGGRLAYLMPLEFLNTGYGTTVKSQLLECGMLKALVQINAEKDVFPDVITSIGIILVANDLSEEPVRFYSVKNIASLMNLWSNEPTNMVPYAHLDPKNKWFKYFDGRSSSVASDDLVAIDYYGNFTRGIATGANEFFAMSPSRAGQLGLPRSMFLSCITKSAQITNPVFTEREFNALEQADANILLLNLTVPKLDAAREYLDDGERLGFHQRYLTKMRKPWHKLEYRSPAPLLFSVFSRHRFKVVRNYTSAVNLTCYHCFYPNLFGQPYVDALFLYFQSRAARRLLALNMRRYGDGLDKFEPNDLNHALAPSPEWFSRWSAVALDEAITECRIKGKLPEEFESTFDSLIQIAERAEEHELESVGR